MNSLQDVLKAVASGELTPEAAQEWVARFAFETHEIGTMDHHRESRTGIPEVIFAQGKDPDDIRDLFKRYAAQGRQLIASRVDEAVFQKLDPEIFHDRVARISALEKPNPTGGKVAVVSAGASDRSVAREAVVCAELFGLQVTEVCDVGVAGLARMTTQLGKITACDVVIVVAGMDGALASVLAGLIRQPLIAVPTSVGYGAAFEGLSALLTMLNSCAPGVVVVNIDNGFGAAAAAAKILNG